jgi:hypothetical protein
MSYVHEDGQWKHKTRLKLFLNPILRTLQFWTREPYVVASDTSFIDGIPHFNHYTFQRVLYFKTVEERDLYKKRLSNK